MLNKIFFFSLDTDDPRQSKTPLYIQEFPKDMPFPLSMPYLVRITISLFLMSVILAGLKTRKVIFNYLTAPETKMIPINVLILINLISSTLFSTTNFTFIMIAIINHLPFSCLLGDKSCKWIAFSGCLGFTGSIIWTCLIAVSRIFYIKAQNWVKFKIGEQRLLTYLVSIGIFLQLTLSTFIFYFDDASFLNKMCSHRSSEDLEIIHTYMVNITLTAFQ
jgi:hypothetical protein